ncbi:dihydroneopterin aldolase/2-amino-4-hydroxy-6-hydroxymethyldihydropteridine diphosphokinase [Georgenia soli]|uniref:Bifunctional folate synthesis protein n=1 Tax=Georgenia soli TaxID=638953 RepID=A0A2A9EN14_9MICO|nr:dihydroneopterin aldolase/2-amino-4-hydroxy-6-hydroxymethyldihydropteridine diphosphokinase [Georgenia soli]
MTGAGGPVLDDDGRELDRIRLLGVRARGHHGVLEHERRDGQEFSADVVLHLDTRAAGRADDLALTVSYADVGEDVVAVLAGEPVDLVETLAERIADAALARPGVRAVDVTVHKPQAPLTVPFDDVQVSVRRRAATAGRVAGAAGDAETAEAAVAEIAEAAAPGDADDSAPLRRRPARPVPLVLALGANLGDAVGTLREAVTELAHAAGVSLTTVSPLARTAPVLAPGQASQPDYLNAVVLGTTTLAPAEVLALAHRVEDDHDRRRTERWGARTLDVDVVAYGDLVSDDPELTLPHPRAHERAFVLAPWARAEPTAVLPGPHGGPVADLAARARDRATLTWAGEDWLRTDPRTAAEPAVEGER